MNNPNQSHAVLIAEIADARQQQRDQAPRCAAPNPWRVCGEWKAKVEYLEPEIPVMELEDIIKRQSNQIAVALAYLQSGQADAAQIVLEAAVQ